MPRKMYNSYGSKESHMDAGVSYAGAPQGYYSDAGKPMGSYGKPRNGYIDQQGMPNAGKMKKNMEYMASYYSGGGGDGVAGGVSNSTNAGTSPSESSMDSTYSKGQATIGKPKGRKKYS